MDVLVVDASCIAYFLEGCLERFDMLENQDARKALILYIQERLFLNTPVPMSVVWCLDSKPYWRSRFEPEYKATRGKHSLDISPTINLLNTLGCYTLSCAEYEADDMASAVVRMLPGNQHYLLTTDSDWMGMIQDNVTMLSPLFEPRVREPVHAWGWLRGKYAKLPKCQQTKWAMPDVVGFDPRSIWGFKVVYGDQSDNLPPNCHPGLIDLFNPIVDPLKDSSFDPSNLMDCLDTSIKFDERRAQQFARSLSDLPFNPIRIGAR